MTTFITIEPTPANPGYTAYITGHRAAENDPIGSGPTREAAALDLARTMLESGHPCVCLAIAAVLREEMIGFNRYATGTRAGYRRAIATVEGIA